VLLPLLRDPVEYVWSVVLEQAVAGLQQSWTASVVAPLGGLRPPNNCCGCMAPVATWPRSMSNT